MTTFTKFHKIISANTKKRFSLLLVALLMCLPVGQVMAQINADQDSFITTWETKKDMVFNFPGEGSYTINWGDGAMEETVTGPSSHRYAAAGSTTIRVTNSITGFNLAKIGRLERELLLRVEQWGTAEWTTMHTAFFGATNLTISSSKPVFSLDTSMEAMFSKATNFNSDIRGWDVGEVTNMASMFGFAEEFDQDNISGWDVSKVKNMNNMFRGSTVFNADIGGWDVRKVTDMTDMFTSAAAFSQNLGRWYAMGSVNSAYNGVSDKDVLTLSAQNTSLENHKPVYTMVSGTGDADNGKFEFDPTRKILRNKSAGNGTFSVRIGVTSSNESFFGTNNVVVLNIVIDDSAVGVVDSTRVATDARLLNLTLSEGTTLKPAFASDTIDYTVNVPYAMGDIAVTPTVIVNSATAIIRRNTVAATNPIQLTAGDKTTIEIIVTPMDGTSDTKTYTVTVTREPDPTTDDRLSALTLSAGSLVPAFNLNTLAYTISVGNDVSTTTVTPTVNESGATVDVQSTDFPKMPVLSTAASDPINLTAGEGVAGETTITITVTAETPGHVRLYEVTVTRSLPLAMLDTLIVSASADELSADPSKFDPIMYNFVATETDYTVYVPINTIKVRVTPTFTVGTVTVGGVRMKEIISPAEPVVTEANSQEIALTIGTPTTITLTLTGATETHLENTYTLTIRVGASFTELSKKANNKILPVVAQIANMATLNAITDRIEAATSGEQHYASSLNFNGQESLSSITKQLGSAIQNDSLDLKRWLGNSEFNMGLNENADNVDNIGLWGSGNYSSLQKSDSAALEWEGQLSGIQLGADTQLSRDWLVGGALALSEGDFDFTDNIGDKTKGTYEYQNTSINPYLSWSPSADFSIWSTLGFGTGEIGISNTDTSDTGNSDMTQFSYALGTTVRVFNADNDFGGKDQWHIKGNVAGLNMEIDGLDCAATADNCNVIDKASLSSQRLRLALEVQRQYLSNDGASLIPNIILSALSDSGDGESGTGIELGGGVHYQKAQSGFSLSAQARSLFAHEYDEWGLQIQLRQQSTTNSGLSFSLTPSIGATQSRIDDLWAESASALSSGHEDVGAQLDSEMSYSMNLPARWEQTLHWQPYTGLALSTTQRRYRFGSRYLLGKDMSLNLEAGRHEADDKAADNSIQIKGELTF